LSRRRVFLSSPSLLPLLRVRRDVSGRNSTLDISSNFFFF